MPPAAVRQPLRRRRFAGGGGPRRARQTALQVLQVSRQPAALGFAAEGALRRGQELQQRAVVARQVAGHAVGHELGDGGGAAAGAERRGKRRGFAVLDAAEDVLRGARLPSRPRPGRDQTLVHVRHETRGERRVPPRAVRGGAPRKHGTRHRVHERARVPIARAGDVEMRGARNSRRHGVRGVEGARRVHREQGDGGVGAVPQAPEPASGAADRLRLRRQAASQQRELLRGAVHEVRGVLLGAHLERSLQPEPGRLGGVRGRPRAVRRAAQRLDEANHPLQVVRRGALLQRRGGVHRAGYAGGDDVRADDAVFGFFDGGFFDGGGAFGGVVVAAAAAQAPLCELHVVEQLPVARGEARGAVARLALGELAEGRQRVEVGGHRAGRGDPPRAHRLEQPGEHFAHARRARGARHGEERLGERTALATAQAAARTQTLHLVRETLEVRVEHLKTRVQKERLRC